MGGLQLTASKTQGPQSHSPRGTNSANKGNQRAFPQPSLQVTRQPSNAVGAACETQQSTQQSLPGLIAPGMGVVLRH